MRYSHDSSIKMLTLDFQNTNDFMKKRNPSLYHVIISNPSFYILRLLKDYWKKIIKSIDTSLSIEKESLKNSHFHQQPPRLLKTSAKTDQNTRTCQANFVSQRNHRRSTRLYISYSPSIFAPPPPPPPPFLVHTRHLVSIRFAYTVFKLKSGYLYTGLCRSRHAHKTKILIYPRFIDRLKSAESRTEAKMFCARGRYFSRPWNTSVEV